eukprot:TRINITY_DN445_c0_g1_i6.p2 TRINITY_DN445_c0_g1~~TRINITY_DN445_c0_g1_i6.p2  ORF type:complete len:259 (-),score=55.05 TRINITY_DN445_c0_g1_i6:168-944(-)
MEFIDRRTTWLEEKQQRQLLYTPADEVVLFLIHFRHYPYDILLSSMFTGCKQTVNSTRHRMQEWFFIILSPELSWGSPESRLADGAVAFFDDDMVLAFLVDGSEEGVKGSQDPTTDLLTWSNKKKQPSVTALVFTALNGRVLGIGESRFGSDNDDVLLTEEPIKWKESLSPKEFGFGDSAFNKHQHLQVYTIRNQGSLHRHFSHYRIRIEISIGKIKKFGAASSIIRMIVQGNEEAVLRHHHQVWVIGAVFVNRYKLG